MKKIIIIFLVLLLAIVTFFIFQKRAQKQVPYVEFDVSMNRAQFPDKLQESYAQSIYLCLKKIFYQNSPQRVTYHPVPLIPKKIHQIWLGSPLPEEYAVYAQTFKQLHPGWEYKLWTDADLAVYPLKNRDLFERAINYGEKADIARYEILYNEGGVYVDTDYECLKPLDVLHHCYEFYIGIQPLDTAVVQLGIGLIGSKPRHMLLKQAIEQLRIQSTKTKQIVWKTGPLFFTKIFCEVAPALTGPIIALPASYLYPRAYYQKKEEQNIWKKPESFAVHHWAGSWLKKEAFIMLQK